MKVSNGYLSIISRCVDLRQNKLSKLKSHTQSVAEITKAINKEVVEWFAHHISLNYFYSFIIIQFFFV